jgi:hypothetical protein
MLKKLPIIIALAGAALGASSAQAALSINFVGGAAASNLGGTAIVESFNGFNVGDSFGGGLQIQGPPSNGTGAVPAFGSSGNYLSVQNGQASSYTILVPLARTVSFVIGSLDTFNRVILERLNGPDIILNGSQITNGTQDDGNQVMPTTNGRLFYTDNSDYFTGVRFASFGTAFEIDNISVAAPEPATWGMMLLAVGMAGAALRRRRFSAMA